jgi:hypothetical protein
VVGVVGVVGVAGVSGAAAEFPEPLLLPPQPPSTQPATTAKAPAMLMRSMLFNMKFSWCYACPRARGSPLCILDCQW